MLLFLFVCCFLGLVLVSSLGRPWSHLLRHTAKRPLKAMYGFGCLFYNGLNLIRVMVTCCMVLFELNVITFARLCVIISRSCFWFFIPCDNSSTWTVMKVEDKFCQIFYPTVSPLKCGSWSVQSCPPMPCFYYKHFYFEVLQNHHIYDLISCSLAVHCRTLDRCSQGKCFIMKRRTGWWVFNQLCWVLQNKEVHADVTEELGQFF